MTKYENSFFNGYDEILKIRVNNKEYLIIHSEQGITLMHSTETFTRRIEGVENCLEYLKGILTDQYICKIEQSILELV